MLKKTLQRNKKKDSYIVYDLKFTMYQLAISFSMWFSSVEKFKGDF